MTEKPMWLIAIPDDMECWDQEIAKQVGQIWSVYIIDPNIATHCCEITPSFWLEYLDSFYERSFYDKNGDMSREMERKRDQLEDDIRTGQFQADCSCYVHCSSIMPLFMEPNKCRNFYMQKWRDGIPAFGWVSEFEGDNDEERMENAREHWQGNPPFGPIEIDSIMPRIRAGEDFNDIQKEMKSAENNAG